MSVKVVSGVLGQSWIFHRTQSCSSSLSRICDEWATAFTHLFTVLCQGNVKFWEDWVWESCRPWFKPKSHLWLAIYVIWGKVFSNTVSSLTGWEQYLSCRVVVKIKSNPVLVISSHSRGGGWAAPFGLIMCSVISCRKLETDHYSTSFMEINRCYKEGLFPPTKDYLSIHPYLVGTQ